MILDACAEWMLAYRLAKREAISRLNGFRIFLACIALGVFTIAAVGSLSHSITNGINSSTRSLLGGDIEISQRTRDLNPTFVKWIKNNSTSVSRVIEMRSMASANNDAKQTTIVELKIVDNNYPLYGGLSVTPSRDPDDLWKTSTAEQHVAFVDPTLFDRLAINMGDTITIGSATFSIGGVIDKEPDQISSMWSIGPRLGPRVLINRSALGETELGEGGTLSSYKLRAKLATNISHLDWEKRLKAKFAGGMWRIRSAISNQPTITQFVEQLSAVLTLAGITGLLVGGIGISNSVRSYLNTKISTIATLKSLGAKGSLIFRIYLIQIFRFAALGVCLGLALGILVPLCVIALLQESLPVNTILEVHFWPLMLAASYGFLTAIAFSIWPLAIAREIPAATLLRRLVEPTIRWPRLPYLIFVLFIATALLLLAVFGAGQPQIAKWFVVAGILVVVVFIAAALLILYTLAKPGLFSHTILKLAMANITRPGAPSLKIILSVGTGLTLLVTIALVQSNLNTQIARQTPKTIPSFFFIDVQRKQIAPLSSALMTAPGFLKMEAVPSLRGRLIRIAGVDIDEADLPSDGQWIKRFDFGATYAKEKPERADIVTGKWWASDYRGKPIISLDSELAETMGVTIGDTLTFNILGREITATIFNLRQIHWDDFGINFFAVFGPGALEKAPHTYLATASIDANREATIYSAITKAFPNVTVVRIKEVIRSAADFLSKIASAATGTSMFTIVAGLLVLGGIVAGDQRQRTYEAVILKIFGATRADLLKVYALEFLILGLVTSVIAFAIGTIFAWMVVTLGFQADWTFALLPGIQMALGGIVATALLGLSGTWRILGKRPGPIIRRL